MRLMKKSRQLIVKQSRRRLRLKAIAALGGYCKACNISDFRVLEFDHIEPVQWRTNGKVKMNGQQNTNEINKMVKRGENPTEKFQLLCANCHKIKTYENNDNVARG